MTQEKKRPGPKTPPIGVEGQDWEDAMAEALKVKRPEKGWPKPAKKERPSAD